MNLSLTLRFRRWVRAARELRQVLLPDLLTGLVIQEWQERVAPPPGYRCRFMHQAAGKNAGRARWGAVSQLAIFWKPQIPAIVVFAIQI